MQRVDFTKDYQSGLSQLLGVLIPQNLGELNADSQQSDEQIRQNPVKNRIASTDKKQKTLEHVKPRFQKNYLLIGGVIVFILAGLIFILPKTKESREDYAWQIALTENDSSSYLNFLKKFPTSKYLSIAQIKFDSIIASKSSIRVPNAINRQSASDSIARVTKMYTEDNDIWAKAVAIDDLSGYKNYYNDFPNGLHRTEAKRIIDYKEQLLKVEMQTKRKPTEEKQTDFKPQVQEKKLFSVSFKLSVVNSSNSKLVLSSCDVYADGKYLTSLQFTDDGIGIASNKFTLPPGVHRFTAKDAAPLYYQNGSNGDMDDTFSDIEIQDNTVLYITVRLFKPASDWVWTPRWINFYKD